MRLAIDMDEVLADTHRAKAALYADLGYAWSDAELAGRRVKELAPPEIEAQVEGEMHKGLFFADIPPIEGANEAIEALAERHEIFVATAAMEYPASCVHKIAWMNRHFPGVATMNLVLCGDKSIVAADVLIDNSPRHFDDFTGVGVCFSALHNLGAKVPYRLDRWDDALDLLDRIEREGCR